MIVVMINGPWNCDESQNQKSCQAVFAELREVLHDGAGKEPVWSFLREQRTFFCGKTDAEAKELIDEAAANPCKIPEQFILCGKPCRYAVVKSMQEGSGFLRFAESFHHSHLL